MPAEDLNVSTDVALCRPCGLFHKLSSLVDPAEPEEVASVDLSRPPAGAWYRRDGDVTVMGVSHRSLPTAAGLLFFCLFWNGIVSVFVALALSSTLRLLGWSRPDWFPGPRMNGADMGWPITIGLWLFLTPFILIGLAMLAGFLSALGGRTEVTLRDGQGMIFGGIGPVGWRRRFRLEDVRAVRLGEKTWRNRRGVERQTHEIRIELREGKPLRLGSGLSEERRGFLLGALRQELAGAALA